jgi:hypothetical protein
MPVSDADHARLVQLLIADLHATIGSRHDHVALNSAGRLRRFIDDVDSYVQNVVDDTQQNVHDEFIDTAWPRCPGHAHPMWFRGGWWWCERDGKRVAPLGQLNLDQNGRTAKGPA